MYIHEGTKITGSRLSDVGWGHGLGQSPLVCPTAVTPAASFADYVNLVRCVERALPQLTPRQMLSLLRQIYYGAEPWSLHQLRFWPEIIPCGLPIPDPRPTLGAPLFTSLQRSQDVAGTAISHMFTGLEAMMCPTATVTLHVAPLMNVVVQMPNEEFASWGGDLGSAVAQRVRDQVDQSISTNWSGYFGGKSRASDEDLNGDIDSYAIRQGLTGASCGATRLTRIAAIKAPISQILDEYYSAGSTPLGAARTNRFSCFVQAIGGTVIGRTIADKSTLATKLAPRVYSFADTFYARMTMFPPSGMAARSVFLSSYSDQISKLFLDWVEKRL